MPNITIFEHEIYGEQGTTSSSPRIIRFKTTTERAACRTETCYVTLRNMLRDPAMFPDLDSHPSPALSSKNMQNYRLTFLQASGTLAAWTNPPFTMRSS